MGETDFSFDFNDFKLALFSKNPNTILMLLNLYFEDFDIITNNKKEISSILKNIKDLRIIILFFNKGLFCEDSLLDINDSDSLLLHSAAFSNNIELVKFLLSYPEIDVNIQSKLGSFGTPIFGAFAGNNIEIIKLLLSHPKIDINKKSNFYNHSLLNEAIRYKHNELVKLLLSRPEIDVNIEQEIEWYFTSSDSEKHNKFFRCIPLHTAIEYENIEILKLLLSRPEIDVNKRSEYFGINAICIAVNTGNLEAAQILLNDPRIIITESYMKKLKFITSDKYHDKNKIIEELDKYSQNKFGKIIEISEDECFKNDIDEEFLEFDILSERPQEKPIKKKKKKKKLLKIDKKIIDNDNKNTENDSEINDKKIEKPKKKKKKKSSKKIKKTNNTNNNDNEIPGEAIKAFENTEENIHKSLNK